MKVGDLVKLKKAYPSCYGHDDSQNSLGIVLEILFDDYWGDTAVVWWGDEAQYEHEQQHLEVHDESR